ncbi:MAG: sodium:calcium antiporter, partial [Plesiomonas sp.]
MDYLLLAIGLVLLVVGADGLVKGAARLAASIGIPSLVIGLTVVAFGTSAPELAVSIRSALAGQSEMAIANVVGSNIFNVLFILGLAAIITPLAISRQLIRQDVPLMVLASMLVFYMIRDGVLSR